MSDESSSSFIDVGEHLSMLAGDGWFARTGRRLLRRVLKLDASDLAIRVANQAPEGVNFYNAFLRAAGIEVEIPPAAAAALSSDGGTLIVSNHPHGGADALALTGWAIDQRPNDCFVLANRMLTGIPGLAPHMLVVEIFDIDAHAHENARSMRAAVACLRRGGIVVAFPAGGVSHFQWSKLSVTDDPWSPHVASLARLGKATTLPVYIPTGNSFVFHFVGLFHGFLRTMMLPRIFRLRGQTLRPVFGQPVPPEELEGQPADGRTAYLRQKVYQLR